MQRRVDDLGVDAGDLAKNGGDVRTVKVDGVDVGEAVRVFVEGGQVLELLGQVVYGGVARHVCGGRGVGEPRARGGIGEDKTRRK